MPNLIDDFVMIEVQFTKGIRVGSHHLCSILEIRRASLDRWAHMLFIRIIMVIVAQIAAGVISDNRFLAMRIRTHEPKEAG